MIASLLASPAEAGTSGRKVSAGLDEAPASAGVTA
jgi:hypothetical protein